MRFHFCLFYFSRCLAAPKRLGRVNLTAFVLIKGSSAYPSFSRSLSPAIFGPHTHEPRQGSSPSLGYFTLYFLGPHIFLVPPALPFLFSSVPGFRDDLPRISERVSGPQTHKQHGWPAGPLDSDTHLRKPLFTGSILRISKVRRVVFSSHISPTFPPFFVPSVSPLPSETHACQCASALRGTCKYIYIQNRRSEDPCNNKVRT